jgi:hypothetical protein
MHSNKVNKLKLMPLLHQSLSQPASFILATMWIAGTPSVGMCYHKHTLPCLPDVLHTCVPSLVTHITQFRKSYLVVLPSLALFPSSTILRHVSVVHSTIFSWRIQVRKGTARSRTIFCLLYTSYNGFVTLLKSITYFHIFVLICKGGVNI